MNYTADPLIKVGLRPDYSEAFNEMNNAIAGIATTSSSFWEANNGGIRYQGHIAVGDGQVDSIGASQILTGTLSATITNQVTTTNTSGTVASVLNELIVNPAADAGTNYIGQDGIVEIKSGNSVNHTGLILGDAGAAYHYGSGLVTNMIGGFFIAEAQSTGNVTNMWAIRSAGIHGSSGDIDTFYGYQHQQIMLGSNDVTVNYGVLVSGAIVVGGTIGTNYGARIAGQNTGTTDYGLVLGFSDTNTLWVNDGTNSTTEAGGIVFGLSKDTNLYRSAANTLKTDDSLVCADINTGNGAVELAAGTYTPTRSAETNMDANVTMTEAQYMRVGATVTVSGRFTADPTLTATTTSFEITLPVASNIGAAEDAAGTATCGNIVSMCAEVTGVAANDTAKIQWKSSDVTSQAWSYSFTYQII